MECTAAQAGCLRDDYDPSGRVWIATGHTDMRCGMQSLALKIQESFKRDPHGGDLYIFRGRRGDLVKICGMTASEYRCTQSAGPRQVYLALGVWRRAVDLGGADGVHAGRD